MQKTEITLQVTIRARPKITRPISWPPPCSSSSCSKACPASTAFFAKISVARPRPILTFFSCSILSKISRSRACVTMMHRISRRGMHQMISCGQSTKMSRGSRQNEQVCQERPRKCTKTVCSKWKKRLIAKEAVYLMHCRIMWTTRSCN